MKLVMNALHIHPAMGNKTMKCRNNNNVEYDDDST